MFFKQKMKKERKEKKEKARIGVENVTIAASFTVPMGEAEKIHLPH